LILITLTRAVPAQRQRTVTRHARVAIITVIASGNCGVIGTIIIAVTIAAGLLSGRNRPASRRFGFTGPVENTLLDCEKAIEVQ